MVMQMLLRLSGCCHGFGSEAWKRNSRRVFGSCEVLIFLPYLPRSHPFLCHWSMSSQGYQLSMPEHFRIGMLWQWEPLYFGYSTRKRIDSVFISHARFMVLMTIEWLLHHRYSMSDSVLPITLFRSDGLDILRFTQN
ncbi:hypothetical protein BDBG_05921 [Blastomyces gilchristii SLH14081]|uniref:Uncharacterized protein n=1 Tax=Blastomyces gilchristii (strain SLH14081) TaxID=559298 RepID=A0A179UQ81_BLAGS|nr:uncharacterized protein BDBG_05921 [Blastomyces gilchristii SLH14081]OAT10256.1 hypothetical protein BDBG_05921 [Blastomyces gilchristii SLH14081]